jgi:DNA-binding transcriptional regulator YdaS (Cro superfamily)
MNHKELTVKRRTLGRALEVAGDESKLARFFGLPADAVRDWSSGRTEVPMAVFLALIDIVASNALTPASLANLERLPFAPHHRSFR